VLQPNCAASTQRVLNLCDGVGCPNEIIKFRLRHVGVHENPVSNVAGWLAAIPKGARHFHIDTLHLDVALSSVTVKIIAKACRQSGKQQFAPFRLEPRPVFFGAMAIDRLRPSISTSAT
jgi:hypothetical protein